MKRNLIIIALSLVSIISLACPRPTSHAIVRVGAAYEHTLPSVGSLSLDNLGVAASLGWESPCRWSTISLETTCVNLKHGTNWSLGAEYALNPLGIMVNSPVNFHVLVGCGYNSIGSVYTAAGLEVSLGQNITPFAPYVSAKVGYNKGLNGVNDTLGVNFNIGFRFSIGQSW